VIKLEKYLTGKTLAQEPNHMPCCRSLLMGVALHQSTHVAAGAPQSYNVWHIIGHYRASWGVYSSSFWYL